MKFVTKKTHRYGTTLVIPIVGEVEISQSGEIEVPEELVEEFSVIEGTGFEPVGVKETPTPKPPKVLAPETKVSENKTIENTTPTVEPTVSESVDNVQDPEQGKSEFSTEVLSDEERVVLEDKLVVLKTRLTTLKQETAKLKVQQEIDEIEGKLK